VGETTGVASGDVGANVFIHQGSFVFRSVFGSVIADRQGGGLVNPPATPLPVAPHFTG
jgi:hypothetical protein